MYKRTWLLLLSILFIYLPSYGQISPKTILFGFFVEKDSFEIRVDLSKARYTALETKTQTEYQSLINQNKANIIVTNKDDIFLNSQIYDSTHTYSEEVNSDISLNQFLYNNPVRCLLIVLGICFLIIDFLIHFFALLSKKRIITEMKEKSQFGAVLCNSFDTVCEWDLNANNIQYFFFINNQLLKQKDYFSLKDYIEHSKKYVIHPEEIETFSSLFSLKNMELIIEKRNTIYKEFRLLTPGSRNRNSYEWHAYTIQAFSNTPKKRSIIVCTKNIDDEKHSEELKNEQLKEALIMAEKANKSKSMFLSRMSHEIRTPLNAILGFITLAKRTITNSQKSLDYITKSEYASKHLLSLINDILNMSAIESGQMKIHNEHFELKRCILSLATTFYGQARLKNIQFKTIISNLSEEYVSGDQTRLNQILMNLLSNAIKFTPANGSVTLSIVQKFIKDNKVYIQFEVSDTGIGMSPKFLEKIGKPFEQESAQISQKFGGSGLGISISKNLVTAMNGTMLISSTENSGSTFTIEIPFDLVVKDKNPIEKIFTNKKVLLLTMDNGLGNYEENLFKIYGVTAKFANSIDTLKKQVSNEREPCNLCIIDIDAVTEDPVTFINQVTSIIPEKTTIALLSYDFSLLEENAPNLLIKHYVQKPLFHSTVQNLLYNVFNKDSGKIIKSKKNTFSGHHILLAEDNEFNKEIAVDILSEEGFLVDSVNDGKEAVFLFEKSAIGFYDIILLDIQMPFLNGYDACRTIRNLSRTDAKTIPIIAMTANAFAEDVSKALSSGMNNHISKPIDTQTLFAVLQQYL